MSNAVAVVSQAQSPQALVLVDHANVYPRDAAGGVLEQDVLSVAMTLRNADPSLGVFRFRFYGGWKHDGMLSAAGSQVTGTLTSIDPFPVPAPAGSGRHGTILRGSLELATTLACAPSIDLGDTVRTRAGFPTFRRGRPKGGLRCPTDVNICPMSWLAELSRSQDGQCWQPGCSETVTSALTIREQKMVDTHLASDLVFFAGQMGVGAVAAVTEDSDFIPPMVHSALQSKSASVWLFLPRPWSPELRAPLESVGIRIEEMRR